MASSSESSARRLRNSRWNMDTPEEPVTTNFFHRHAVVSLDVVVVGGSIDGLAAAYNLKQAGHRVRVFEKLGTKGGSPESNKLHKVKGCMRVSPNMMKCLQQWGLKSRLMKCAIKCTKIHFLEGSDGVFHGALIWHEELMKELGADVLGMHYDDLYDMMYDLTTLSGVEVEFGTEVVDMDVEAPSVTLADGRQIQADFIVGADGPFGLTRQRVVGYKEEPEYGPHSTYSFIVKMDDVRADPQLFSLVEDGKWSLWTGDKYCTFAYQVRQDEYVVHFNGPAVEGVERGKPVPLSALDIGQFEERVHRLFALGPSHAREELHPLQPTLTNWFSENGKAVLVGDTVHAPCPSSSNSHALSIEDGATLGCLLSRLQSRDAEEMVRLLSAYQEIRQERCEVTVKSDSDLMTFSTMPPGPERDARDMGFKLSREKMGVLDWTNLDDDLLRESWEEFRFSFGYDAYDAADEWWVSWGLTYKRMNAAQGQTDMGVESALSTFASDDEDSAYYTNEGISQSFGLTSHPSPMIGS